MASLLLGLAAAALNGELRMSWVYVAVDMGLVLLSAIAAHGAMQKFRHVRSLK